jgi:hypothetical protein
MAARPAGAMLSTMDPSISRRSISWRSISWRSISSHSMWHPLVGGVVAVVAAAIALALAVVSVAGPVPTGRAEREAGPAAHYATSVAVSDAAVTPVPASLDFRDCPPLPAGAQPDRWRCEVLVATGRLQLGRVAVPAVAPITVTHAEGPLPDGTTGQVFGALRAGRTDVPGGLVRGRGAGGHNPLLHLGLRTEYAGHADLVDRSVIDVRLRLINPLLGHSCVIGDPVRLTMSRDGNSEWLSENPPLIRFRLYERSFALPVASGCGPLRGLVDRRFGLPSAAGANEVYFTAYHTFRTYG